MPAHARLEGTLSYRLDSVLLGHRWVVNRSFNRGIVNQSLLATYRNKSYIARARASVKIYFLTLACSTALIGSPVFSESLSSANEFDRAKAAIAFGKAKDVTAVSDLVARYPVETSKMVKLYILQALIEIPWDGKISLLETALSDNDADIRLKAARALGKFEWPNSNPALTEALSDSDLRVQAAAATALGGAAARTTLLRLAGSSDPAIKSQGLLGLAAIHAEGAEVSAVVNAARSHADAQVRAAAEWAAQALAIEVNP